MYLKRFSVHNIRSISDATMEFAHGAEAGWHVILGSNGAGKSSLVRAFALLMMGEKEAWASRQDFEKWIRKGENESVISGDIAIDTENDLLGNVQYLFPDTDVSLKVSMSMPHRHLTTVPTLKFVETPANSGIWDNGPGWFAVSFGPFRRFTGGDASYDRLFKTNKRLAAHLTALGEDVALTDAMAWLSNLAMRDLQAPALPPHDFPLFNLVANFLNASQLLPHDVRISGVANNSVEVKDGNHFTIMLDQLSDGYRSALSLAIELIRQMFEFFGEEKMIQAMRAEPGKILAPGVVAIDEVDVHLHPTWQRDIGKWLTRCFPNVQFIVTTHSPIVCRAIVREDGSLHGSVWRLPAPGCSETFRRVDESELNQLLYGDVLDAYATELFGTDVLRSQAGNDKLERLAELNIRAVNSGLSAEEQTERQSLRKLFPANAGSLQG